MLSGSALSLDLLLADLWAVLLQCSPIACRDDYRLSRRPPIARLDLVPMLSWLWTRGQCRYCHKKIGLRYLGIELAISLACALSAVLVGPLL